MIINSRSVGNGPAHIAGGLTAALLAAALMCSTAAAQNWDGSASTDWTTGANWSGNAVPVLGAVTINTTTPNSAVLGVTGPDAATSGTVTIGTSGGTGNLTIQNGSTLASQTRVSYGATAGSTGVATVTGVGSTWTMNVPVVGNSFRLGSFGAGTLNVRDGGSVAVTGGMSLGFSSGGRGTLNIESGGTLTTSNFVHIGGSTGGTIGLVTVTGATSLLDVGTDLVLGLSGNGTLNIQNGGTAVAGVTTVSVAAASTGSLNISGDSTLETSRLVRGGGTAQVNFDSATLRATADNATFVTGFLGSELAILTGGLTIDSAGFNVTAASPFSGVGQLTKVGSGTLTLTAANTYSGQTWIQSGTLALSGGGSLANSSGVVADGTFDISGVTPTGVSVQRLAGTVATGTVLLGGKTLTITNANDTFAGTITGTGGLTVSGGTETLTGASNYTGATNVTGTGNLQILNGGQVNGTSATTLNGPSATATVSGAGSLLQTGTLVLGGSAGGNAALNVLNGGVVRTVVNTDTQISSGSAAQTTTINVDGAGSLLDLAGALRVGTGGPSSNARLNVTNGGTVESTGGFVGSFNAATGTKTVLISGPGSSWTMSGALSINGGGSVSVLNGGVATAASSSIGTAPGMGSLLISGLGSDYSIAGNVTIGGNGTVTLDNGGRMSVGGVLTLASTAGANGVLNIGGAEGQAAMGAGILDAATLTFGPGTGRLNFNHTDTHYEFATVLSGTGTVNHTGPGLTEITGNSAAFTGTTNAVGGTLAVNGGLCGDMNVLAGGRLQGTGTVCDTTNFAGGVIAPGNSIGTLTVAGDYTSNGGTLEVEAVLGTDGSPADLLHITGDSLLGTGVTGVTVLNVGGTGGVTTGDGILIVQADGATSEDVFTLTAPAIGGAYSYNLFQNDLAGLGGDWYLRSAGLAPTTPTFENYPVALLGMTELPTLRQRVGDRVDAVDGVWSRIEGAAGHYQAASSDAGASYDSSLFLAQIGVEGALVDGPDGSLVAGFSAQYSRNSAAVFSAYGNGNNVTEGMGIGATLTWRGAEGTYVDLQGQLAKFWTDLDAIGYRLVSDNGGTGLAVSLEAGHEIALDDAWSITPQAQLSYASVGFDRFTDGFGSVISLEAGNSLKGRIGLAVDYRTDLEDQDATASIGGVANLTYEFLDGATVAVSGTNLHYAAQKFSAELGLGGTLEWNGGAQALHAEILGATSFRGSYAVKGTVGFNAGF